MNYKFPLDVFPESLRQVILDAESKSNFPVEYTASSMLYAFAVAAGNQFAIDTCNAWDDKPILYLALVGEPGDNKTHPLKFALKPFLELDELYYTTYIESIESYKATSKDERSNDEPVLKMLLCEDATIEALVKHHANNRISLGLYVDELAGWVKGFTKYDSTGSAIQKYLSAWSGIQLSMSRIKDGEKRVYKPCLSVIGTTQPDRLKYFTTPELVESGFLDRMLFCYPDEVVQVALQWRGTDPIEDEGYRRMLNNLLQSRDDYDGNPYRVTFSEETMREGQKLTDALFQERIKTDDSRRKGIYIKFQNYYFRLVLITWIMHWADGLVDKYEPVSVDIVEKAGRLTMYFITQSLKVNNEQFEQSALDRLPENQRKWYEALPQNFTTKEARELGEKFGLSYDSVRQYLSRKKDLFRKEIKQGEYSKLFF